LVPALRLLLLLGRQPWFLLWGNLPLKLIVPGTEDKIRKRNDLGRKIEKLEK
jgi:hypothetical protein